VFEPFDKIEKVVLEVLEDEVDLSFLLEGLLDAHNIIAL